MLAKVIEMKQTALPELLELQVEILETEHKVNRTRILSQVNMTMQERAQKDVRCADTIKISLNPDGRPYVRNVLIEERDLDSVPPVFNSTKPSCKSCVHLQALKDAKPEYTLENLEFLAYDICDLADEMNLLADYILCYYSDDTKKDLEVGGIYAMSTRLPKQIAETLDKLEVVAGNNLRKVHYKEA